MYAGIQTGTLTLVSASCEEDSVSLPNKKMEKRWKKSEKNTYTTPVVWIKTQTKDFCSLSEWLEWLREAGE